MKIVIILILLLIGIQSCNAQSTIKIKKTTWYVNGKKGKDGGNFIEISFDPPYVHFYSAKKNNEKGTVTFKMDSYAGGIFIGHDILDEGTEITIDTVIPSSAITPTYTVTIKKGNISAKAILELDR